MNTAAWISAGTLTAHIPGRLFAYPLAQRLTKTATDAGLMMRTARPGDRWPSETLLVAAMADCFMLTFRALAARSKLPRVSLTAEVPGTPHTSVGQVNRT
jgi:organic hydroperoxide reductase OsmC/OhrA